MLHVRCSPGHPSPPQRTMVAQLLTGWATPHSLITREVMMPILVLLIAFFAFLTAPAAADHEQQFDPGRKCFPVDWVLQSINEQYPIRHAIKLDEQQTKDILFWWNSQPPESEDTYDNILLVQHEGFIAIILGHGDEICAMGRIPDEKMESFLKALRGVTADRGA